MALDSIHLNGRYKGARSDAFKVSSVFFVLSCLSLSPAHKRVSSLLVSGDSARMSASNATDVTSNTFQGMVLQRRGMMVSSITANATVSMMNESGGSA